MKYMMTVETTAHDTGWIEAYLENVPGMLEEFGGRYLVSTAHSEIMEGEGEAPHSYVIVEFESKEQAYAFYNGQEYSPYKAARIAGSTCRVHMMPLRVEADA
ncbi:DUF1330 domain-containing protein [Paraferrimonas sedimenticola]|uniref:DUF1330 domain-containing protein n=1 Tax=Paraferrimonas sedimenticola TaxID=375674 RepID=A0AA37W1Q0_9GAMM|nr:DUF1330 domain-containing protein [Paraferrimonas sedimenticola]GLP97078.1 hypothetical protein GCM10007895_23840 [Paraferrimonas sedimenticola]